MIHEPRGFLRDADGPVNFIGTDPVFAVDDFPHGDKPLVQAQWRILEDGAGLSGELPGRMGNAALPAIVLLQEHNALALAARTDNAVRPAPGYKVLAAVGRIGE